MAPNPEPFLAHLRSQGYHPRSDKHSNALAEAIVGDLIGSCAAMRSRAQQGQLVYSLNFTLRSGTSDWNVDLVLGEPGLGPVYAPSAMPVGCGAPAVVQVAVEIKSVMTEHRKAVKNRKRDLEAHHEHVHHYNDAAIAGGVLVVNAAARFKSPLRAEPTTHGNPMKLVEHCVDELRAVSTRGGVKGYGLEAKCAIVLDADNLEHENARFVVGPPAPAPGDPLQYDSFIRTICSLYTQRFG